MEGEEKQSKYRMIRPPQPPQTPPLRYVVGVYLTVGMFARTFVCKFIPERAAACEVKAARSSSAKLPLTFPERATKPHPPQTL